MDKNSTNSDVIKHNNILIRFFMLWSNLYSKIAGFFSEKSRTRLSLLGAIIITSIFFAHNMGIILLLNTYAKIFVRIGGFFWDILLAIGVYLLALPLLDKNNYLQYRSTKLNKLLLLPLSIFMLLFGFSAFSSTYGRFKLFILYFCLYLPLLFLLCCKQSQDIIKVIRLLLRTIVFIGFLYYLGSFFLVPNISLRYTGLSLNANGLGQICTCILVASLVEAYFASNKYLFALFHAIGAVSIAFIFVSVSRTSFLAVIAIYLGYLMYSLLHNLKKNVLRLLGALLICIAISFSMSRAFEYQVNLFDNPNNPNNVYFQFLEKITSQEYILNNGINKNQNDKTAKNTHKSELYLFSRFNADENISDDNLYYFKEQSPLYEKIDRITTHRLSIWDAYIQNLKIQGQPSQEIQFDRYRTAVTAHQLFIQIAYDTGIVGGVVYLTFFIISLGYAIIALIKKKDNLFSLFFILAIINYFAIGLVSSNCYSNVYLSSFLFYISLGPFLIKRNEDFSEKIVNNSGRK